MVVEEEEEVEEEVEEEAPARPASPFAFFGAKPAAPAKEEKAPAPAKPAPAPVSVACLRYPTCLAGPVGCCFVCTVTSRFAVWLHACMAVL